MNLGDLRSDVEAQSQPPLAGLMGRTKEWLKQMLKRG
jgi:hypothetical protein